MRTIAPAVWLRILLVASLVLPGAILGVIAWESRRHELEEANRQIGTAVGLLREQMARILQTDELALDLVDQSVQGMTWDEIKQSRSLHARLEALLHRLPQLATISLVGPDGTAAASSRMFPQEPAIVADRDYFVALRDHPDVGTFVSRADLGRLTQRPQFNIVRRRSTAADRFDGVIVLSAKPTYMDQFYRSLAEPDGLAIALARTDGAVLARYPADSTIDLPQASSLLQAARQHPFGVFSGRSSIDGIVRISGFARVEGYPLLVVYGVSRAGVLSDWVNDLLSYGVLTAIGSLVLVLVTWFAMRGEAELAAGRRRLEVLNDDLAHQVTERTRAEVELRDLNIVLEQRVAERTASLSELAEQLERERSRLATFIQATPFAKLVIDRHGEIIMTNIAAEQLFGYRRDELIGQTVEVLVPERYRHGHVGLRGGFLSAATARPMGAGLDLVAARQDGSEVAVEILLNPQQTPAGAVTVVGIVDITARRQAQVALLRANADLVTANQELTLANAIVRQKNEEVEAFVYIVSHDLRAPLINLQGFARELERGCAELRETVAALQLPVQARRRLITLLDEDINGTLPYITASVSKFDRLINALLGLSRTGRYPLHPAPLDVAEVVRATLDALSHSIEGAGARVTIGVLPEAVADATAVGQIFANLIGNAVKFGAPDRALLVEIGGEVDGQHARYWVRDNGRGIPSQAKPRLFQMFQRFHPSVAEGDGIGLATVRRLVERLGGTVWVESEAGVGSIFQFTLPIRPQETAACP